MRINQLNNDEFLITGYRTANQLLKQTLKKKGHQIGYLLKNADLNLVNFIGPITYLRMRFNKKPTITQMFTTSSDLKGGLLYFHYSSKLLTKYITHFCNQSDQVVTISEFAKKRLIKDGVTKDIKVISCGVNLSKIKKIKKDKKKLRTKFRKEFKIRDDETVVLCVGSRSYRKGIDHFYKIARKMPKIKFVWVGGDLKPGILTYKHQMIKEIVNSGLKNLIFTGYYKNVHQCYQGADLFLFPTRAENEGIPIMEAAAHELPIIASNLEVIKEKVKNNQEGILCNTINDYVKAIKKLSNPNERKRFKKKVYEIAKKYDIKKTIDQLIKLFNEVIK